MRFHIFYTKHHQFARIIQLIEQRILFVSRLPIRFTAEQGDFKEFQRNTHFEMVDFHKCFAFM